MPNETGVIQETHELDDLSKAAVTQRTIENVERVSIAHEDASRETSVASPPENAAEDLRPSKRFQVLLVLAGFMMIFQTIGTNQTYGVYQEFYTSPQSNIKDGPGQDALVSLVGTIGSGLTWSGSIFVNPLIARVKNLKLITLSGVVIMSLGLVLASFATKLWHLFLTQSLLYGIGSSMFYFPILSLAPPFFDRHRGAAMGVILSGNGIGGLVLAPVTHQLLQKVGVQWTLRILGLWNLIVCIPIACVVRRRAGFGFGRRSTKFDLSILRRGTFLSQTFGAFLQAAGNVIPLYYLTTYSTAVLSYSSTTGSLLLAINNAVNSVSRIAMGILADRVGRQNTMIASVILSAISVFSFWIDASRSRFLAFIVFYGIYAGGYNALLPTTITEVYGVQNYAPINAAIYFIRGLGTMLGAPIAGVILGQHGRGSGMLAMDQLRAKVGYNNVAIYDGVLLMSAGLCVAFARWSDAHNKGEWVWKA
ncbi:MFS general substrate transporter [Dentipellis sp. KUC8613]|nr:MFS general substrate transporter [Dentipellis sp. KUC8613]